MSIDALRNLVAAIKERGQTISAAPGTTARDLVFLAKTVEAIAGADALLDLVNVAGKPTEVVSVAAPGTAVIALTASQVSREVVALAPAAALTATHIPVSTPTIGWACVFDNKCAIPARVYGTDPAVYATVKANSKAFLYFDGTKVGHVFDVEAAAAAAATPLTTRGDIYVRDMNGPSRLAIAAAGRALMSDGVDPYWGNLPGRVNTRVKALTNDFVFWNDDGTYNPGGNDISLVPTKRLGNLITDAATFPDHANKGIWDTNSQSCMTSVYRGFAFNMADGGFTTIGSSSSGRNGDVNGNHWPVHYPSLYKTNSEGHLLLEDMSNSKVKQVYSNYGTTMVLLENGELYATGYGTHGQQGDGTVSNKNFFQRIVFPVDAGPVRYVVSTCMTGPDSTAAFFALMEDGDVYSWGYNGYGQLGHGDTTNRTSPTKIAVFNQNVRCIEAAGGTYGFVYFITKDNKLYSVGHNGSGQCGDGTTVNKASPVLVDNGPVVKAANTGYNGYSHGYFIKADGKAYAMGNNENGQLGDNSSTSRSVPTLIANLGTADTNKVLDIWAFGARYQCGGLALTKDGKLYAWGQNSNGILGVGDTNNRLSPTIVPGVEHVSMVTCPSTTINQATQYYYGNIALLRHATEADRIAMKNGYVMTCGYSQGALGYPNPANPTMSYKYVGFPPRYHGKVKRLGCAGYTDGTSNSELNYYALMEDGTVFAWGPSSNYSLGNFMNQSVVGPQPIQF